MHIINLNNDYMKTNVILTSESRNLFGVVVRTRTEDSFLCLTDLQTAFEKARIEYSWKERKINDVLSYTQMKERIYELLIELKIIDSSLHEFIEKLDNEGLIDTYKKLGIWEMKGKGVERVVWVNPYVFMSIALEMNPKIYAKVVIWLADTLIMDRIEAGGNYLPMTTEIKNLLGDDVEYWKFAVEINNRVFGKHEKGIRNIASTEQLKNIAKIESSVTDIIKMGLAKTEKDIITIIQNCKL